MGHLRSKVEKGFMIKIDPSVLWRQYSSRTADCMYKHHNEIQKMLQSGINDTKIHIIFSSKFGIRNGFDCSGPEDLLKFIKKKKQEASKDGYIYDIGDNIYKQIVDLIT